MRKRLRKRMPTVLYVVWGAATVAAGIGVGLMLNKYPNLPQVSPTPVATANLTVMSTSEPMVTPQPSTALPQHLPIGSSASMSQAQAGSPFVTASAPAYQPGTGPDSLQPGYGPDAHVQGNIGTVPSL